MHAADQFIGEVGKMKLLNILMAALLWTAPVRAARDYDGVDDMTTVTRAAVQEPTSTVSVWCWVKRDGAQNTNAKIMVKLFNNEAAAPFISYTFSFNDTADDDIGFFVGLSNDAFPEVFTGAGTISDAIWYFLGGAYSDSANRLKIFYGSGVNALTEVETSVNGPRTLKYNATDDITFGDRATTGQEFDGVIGECGLSDVYLSINEFEHIRRLDLTDSEPLMKGLSKVIERLVHG